MTTFLKGDTTAEITLALAGGYDYSGKTVHLEYQGARRSFSGVSAGGVLAFSFTAAETAPMSLGSYPVRMWIEDAGGGIATIQNADARLRVTDCAAEVHTDSAIYLDVRGGLYGIEGLPDRFTDEDLRGKINEILRRLGGTVAMAALALLPVFGGATVEVQTAPKGAIFNDQPVVTNVTVSVPEPDFSTSNAALVATIEAKAPPTDISGKQDRLPYETNAIPVDAVKWRSMYGDEGIRHGWNINGTDEEWQLDGFNLYLRKSNGYAFPLFRFTPDATLMMYDTNGAHRASIGFWGVFDGRRTFDWTDILKVGSVPSWAMAETPPVPANYSSVSSAALSAVQTETDPTVPAWAKTETPPQAMTTNDVCNIVTNEVREWRIVSDIPDGHTCEIYEGYPEWYYDEEAGFGYWACMFIIDDEEIYSSNYTEPSDATSLNFSPTFDVTVQLVPVRNSLGLARLVDLPSLTNGIPKQIAAVTNETRIGIGDAWAAPGWDYYTLRWFSTPSEAGWGIVFKDDPGGSYNSILKGEPDAYSVSFKAEESFLQADVTFTRDFIARNKLGIAMLSDVAAAARDSTNYTDAAIAAIHPSADSSDWVRKGDWAATYEPVVDPVIVTSVNFETNATTAQVFSNATVTTMASLSADLAVELLDTETPDVSPPAVSWSCAASGTSISGRRFTAPAAGLYRVTATSESNGVRYVDVPLTQYQSTEEGTSTYTADADIDGKWRKGVDDAALAVLQSATKGDTIVANSQTCAVWWTVRCPARPVSGFTVQGLRTRIAFTPHLFFSARHYVGSEVKEIDGIPVHRQDNVSYPTFRDPVGGTNVSLRSTGFYSGDTAYDPVPYRDGWGFPLCRWAIDHGFTREEVAQMGVEDVVVCPVVGGTIPEQCCPYFISSEALATRFGEEGAVVGWATSQTYVGRTGPDGIAAGNYMTPCAISMASGGRSWRCAAYGWDGTVRLDLRDQISAMASTPENSFPPIYGGDSGGGIYILDNAGRWIQLSHFTTIASGPTLCRAIRVLRAVAAAYGDTLKEVE